LQRHRQAQDKAGTTMWRIGDPQIATVALGDTPGHDQAQAETGLFATDKRFKQTRQERWSNAWTSIVRPQLNLAVHWHAEADVQAATLGHGVQGVQRQVDEQLLHLVGISLDNDRGGGRPEV
jgi:hypothetical protein